MDNETKQEVARPAAPEGTFASRMNDVALEARESKILALKRQEKSKIFITDDEKSIARALISLMDNDAFKLFLVYETKETGDRMARAFEDVPDAVLKTASFGEKMAFNKGRLYQMEHFRRIREYLISRYLENSKLEKESTT